MENNYASGSSTGNADLTTLLRFAFSAMMMSANTTLPCTIEAITGDNSYTIKQAVNSLSTTAQPLPSPLYYGIPSLLIMGGVAGIIVNYQVGDLVLVGFCQRDISGTLNTQAASNPQTLRKFDMRDGVILGKIPLELPTTYINIDQNQITINAPDSVTVTAPTVTVNASTSATVTTATANIDASQVNLGTGASQPVLLGNVTMTGTLSSPALQGGSGVSGAAVTLTVTTGGSTKVKGAV